MHYWKGFLVASYLSLASPQGEEANSREEQQATTSEERPIDAKALFARFSEMKGLEVSFHEKKYNALLVVPLESRGTIYFLPPGYLTRVIEAPNKSKLTITPDELRLDSRDGHEVMDLRQNVELRTFVTSLVRVFAGDEASLVRSYKIAYVLDTDDGTKWSLSLEPREKPLTEMMRSLRLEGSGVAVTSIELHEPNGDRTVTTIAKVNAKRLFTSQEKADLFGIEETVPAEEKSR